MLVRNNPRKFKPLHNMDKNILSRRFREDCVELLLDANFDDKEANALVDKKYKAKLKEEAVNILKKITRLIEDDKFDEAKEMISYSSAGDCMGGTNMYIDFSLLDLDRKESGYKEIEDIGDVIITLKKLSHE